MRDVVRGEISSLIERKTGGQLRSDKILSAAK